LTTPQFQRFASKKKFFRNSTRFTVRVSISRISSAFIAERAMKSSFLEPYTPNRAEPLPDNPAPLAPD